MSVSEIFLIHNRPWSFEGTIVFTVILFIIICILMVLRSKKIIKGKQLMATLLLYTYLSIVLASTIFTRRYMGFRAYELDPLWSWKYVIRTGNFITFQEIILNIILFMPYGFLLPFVYDRKCSLWKAFLLGLSMSVIIEVSQLVFCLGLFEFADMIHNSLGAVIGCIIGNLVYRIFNKK